MSLGQFAFIDQVGAVPSAPTFVDRVSFAGDASYPGGGYTGFQASLNKITKDGRTPVAVIPMDCGGYGASLNESAGSALSGAGPFALSDGMTLEITVDQPTSDTLDIPTHTVTFEAEEFANIGAATAAEVADALNDFFEAEDIDAVASVTSSTHVTITSGSYGAQSSITIEGGTAAGVLNFVSTQGGSALKLWAQGAGAGDPQAEVTPGTNLSAVTFNLVVISK